MIAHHLERVELGLREPLVRPGVRFTHVYFPETIVASILASTPSGRQSEIALTGYEGMIDAGAINGIDRTPLETFVQITGFAWRMPVAAFHAAVAASASLAEMMRLYMQCFVAQVSNTALVNISHTLEQRLARWLLMTHDRVDGDEIEMTHQFLALMLGVRRAGVTMTVHKLESAAVIKAKRALIIVTNRAGLEQVARDAYGTAEGEYTRLMGVDIGRGPARPNGSYTSIASRA